MIYLTLWFHEQLCGEWEEVVEEDPGNEFHHDKMLGDLSVVITDLCPSMRVVMFLAYFDDLKHPPHPRGGS